MSERIPAFMILARDSDFGFGNFDGSLPWSRVDWDMRHFRNVTEGRVMVMGRKTYESCADNIELGNREIIVLSHYAASSIARRDGHSFAHSWLGVSRKVEESGRVPIFCGGAQIFESVLHGVGSKFFNVSAVWLSQLDCACEADQKYDEMFGEFTEVMSMHRIGSGISGKVSLLERQDSGSV